MMSLALTGAASFAQPAGGERFLETTPGVVKFGEAYQGEAIYICHPSLTTEQGIPTIRVPLALAVSADISFVNGYDSDVLVKVAPESDVLLPDDRPTLWINGQAPNHWKKVRGASGGTWQHRGKYECLRGIGGDRPPAGTNLIACCCMAQDIRWEGRLTPGDVPPEGLDAVTRADFDVPVDLFYIVLARTNIYHAETRIRIIAEKGQPTSASSEPSQSSGR